MITIIRQKKLGGIYSTMAVKTHLATISGKWQRRGAFSISLRSDSNYQLPWDARKALRAKRQSARVCKLSRWRAYFHSFRIMQTGHFALFPAVCPRAQLPFRQGKLRYSNWPHHFLQNKRRVINGEAVRVSHNATQKCCTLIASIVANSEVRARASAD